jgi:V8-like Glu-specific endopeptidase
MLISVSPMLSFIISLILASTAVAKDAKETEAGLCCGNDFRPELFADSGANRNTRVLKTLQEALDKNQKPKGKIRRMSTLFGSTPVTFPNRVAPSDPMNISSGVCKLSLPDATGTSYANASFVGSNLNILLTNMHCLVPQGRVPDELDMEIKCDSAGTPPRFTYEGKVRVKTEAQGRYNLKGHREYPNEDVALLRIVSANPSIEQFRHFSFNITEVSDDFGNLKRRTSGDEAIGVLRALSIPHVPNEFEVGNGRTEQVHTDELLRGDKCQVYEDLGGVFTTDCPILPGSSGGVIYIDRGLKKPMLAGMISQGIKGKGHDSILYIDQADTGPNGRLNRFIPLREIQRIIKGDGVTMAGNPALWSEILKAQRRPAPVQSAESNRPATPIRTDF